MLSANPPRPDPRINPTRGWVESVSAQLGPPHSACCRAGWGIPAWCECCSDMARPLRHRYKLLLSPQLLVDMRGGDVGVSEQLLNGAQLHTAPKHIERERVP